MRTQAYSFMVVHYTKLQTDDIDVGLKQFVKRPKKPQPKKIMMSHQKPPISLTDLLPSRQVLLDNPISTIKTVMKMYEFVFFV